MATNNKLAYASQAAMTITIASLATSSTLLVGRQATAVDNSANLYLDYLISGQIMVGTSPAAGSQIIVYAVAPVGVTNIWPDAFTGSDAGRTIASAGVGQGYLKRVAVLNVDATTSNLGYPFGPVSLATLFGGIVPNTFTLFVTQNTGANLHATAGNHYIVQQGIYTTNG